ncbi:hypothetical protein [Thermoleophilum album]|uniref:hypothetical protein n=1 Tax=Thermoleophilum album TaxID=29539 RepID=UPI00237C78C0|nr:hypothetical protein [Thermoleophilum album]
MELRTAACRGIPWVCWCLVAQERKAWTLMEEQGQAPVWRAVEGPVQAAGAGWARRS